MFDGRIMFGDGSAMGMADHLAPVHAMLDMLGQFAAAGAKNTAPQHDFSAAVPSSLAQRYAAANSITRRRFDALLKEAETIGTVGLRLIVGRGGRQDAGTLAAARFLGKSIEAVIRRLENLLPPPAI